MIKCLRLEDKCENLEFQKMLSLPYRKNKSEQEQNKDYEKGTKRNRESKKKMKRKRDEYKDQGK